MTAAPRRHAVATPKIDRKIKRDPNEVFVPVSASTVWAINRILKTATAIKLAYQIMLLANERNYGSPGGWTAPTTLATLANEIGTTRQAIQYELPHLAGTDGPIEQLSVEDAIEAGIITAGPKKSFCYRLRLESLPHLAAEAIKAEKAKGIAAPEEDDKEDEPDGEPAPKPNKCRRSVRVFKRPLVLTGKRQRFILPDDAQLAIGDAEHIETICDIPGLQNRITWDLTITGNVLRSRLAALQAPPAEAEPTPGGILATPSSTSTLAEQKAKTVTSKAVTDFDATDAKSLDVEAPTAKNPPPPELAAGLAQRNLGVDNGQLAAIGCKLTDVPLPFFFELLDEKIEAAAAKRQKYKRVWLLTAATDAAGAWTAQQSGPTNATKEQAPPAAAPPESAAARRHRELQERRKSWPTN